MAIPAAQTQSARPDSRDHHHCKDHYDIEHSLLNSAMTQLANQTVMTRHDSASCSPLTDVVWIKKDYGEVDEFGSLGKATCVSHAFMVCVSSSGFW